MKSVYYLLKSARPRQWLKNLSLFAALVFTGQLFVAGQFWQVVWAVVIFTILTSAVYIFNDVVDAPQDRLHPFKRKRPIASGELPMAQALFVAVAGFFVALFLAMNLSPFFLLACLGYLLQLKAAYL